jgi:hypothetical protein
MRDAFAWSGASVGTNAPVRRGVGTGMRGFYLGNHAPSPVSTEVANLPHDYPIAESRRGSSRCNHFCIRASSFDQASLARLWLNTSYIRSKVSSK